MIKQTLKDNLLQQLKICDLNACLRVKMRFVCEHIEHVNKTLRPRLYRILNSTEGLFPVTEAVWVLELENELRLKLKIKEVKPKVPKLAVMLFRLTDHEMLKRLTPWERDILQSIKRKKNRTTKQNKVIRDVFEKYQPEAKQSN